MRTDSRGFSFVELLLCVVVIGVLAVSAVALNSNPTSVDSAARRILADLRTAQQLAVTTGLTHGFRNDDSLQYQVYTQTPGNYAEDPGTHQNYLISLNPQFRGSSFAGNYQIEFDSWGRPIVGGGTILSVTDGLVTKSIVVTSTTGAIYLQ